MIRRSSLPVLSFGAGGGLADGVESLPGIESRLLFVDKGDNLFPDGSRQEPFHTVADALTAAAALAPTANSRATILVYPGEYDEAGLASVAHTSLIGVGGRDAVRIGSDWGPVFSVDHESFRVWSLTFAITDDSAAVVRVRSLAGAFAQPAEFRNVRFAMDGDSAQAVRVIDDGWGRFEDCLFVNEGAIAVLTGYASRMDLVRSTVQGSAYLEGGLGGVGVVVIDGCGITLGVGLGFDPLASLLIKDSVIAHSAGHAIDINVLPPGNVQIVNNRLAASVGNYDIAAPAARAGLVIAGNQMTRGIEGTVSHVASERRVGSAGMLDFYPTLQAALDSCTFDKIVVKLEEDVTLTAAATPPARPVTVDGQGHTITRGAGAAAFTSGNSLTLRNARVVGSIDVTAGSPIIEDCDVTGMVDAQGAATVEVRRTEIVGDGTDGYAIRLGHSDAEVTVHHSWLEGHGDGEAAVYWATDNDNLELDYTTVLHGWDCANDPFERSAAETPDFAAHHCTFNVEPDITVWTNIIAPAQRNNTIYNLPRYGT